MSCEIANRLRAACDKRGIRYSCGYRLGSKVVDKDTVTTIWDGTLDGTDKAISFEEDAHGNLFCPDALDVEQAIAAYLAGRGE